MIEDVLEAAKRVYSKIGKEGDVEAVEAYLRGRYPGRDSYPPPMRAAFWVLTEWASLHSVSRYKSVQAWVDDPAAKKYR